MPELVDSVSGGRIERFCTDRLSSVYLEGLRVFDGSDAMRSRNNFAAHKPHIDLAVPLAGGATSVSCINYIQINMNFIQQGNQCWRLSHLVEGGLDSFSTCVDSTPVVV